MDTQRPQGNDGQNAGSKIQHSRPGIILPQQGQSSNPPPQQSDVRIDATEGGTEQKHALPVAQQGGLPVPGAKITAFGRDRKHEESWSRTPNTTGSGAIHVKTFHCKLTEDAVVYMDQAINEWLDAHPQYEVKFVSSTIGTLTGKLKEPALFCQVWV